MFTLTSADFFSGGRPGQGFGRLFYVMIVVYKLSELFLLDLR